MVKEFPWDGLGPVYVKARLAHLARQPGKQDEFLLCLYEKISSRLLGQFCCFDSKLKIACSCIFELSSRNQASLLVRVYMEKFPSR